MKLRLIALLLLLLLLLSGCTASGNANNADTTPTDTTPPHSEIQNQIHDFFGPTDLDHPPCFVIESYTDLQELYSVAANLPYVVALEGNWLEARNSALYPESFFADNYLVAAMVSTDCQGYAFRASGVKNDHSNEIIVYVLGERPFPFELSNSGALHLIPIKGQYAGEPVKLDELYVKYETQIQFTFDHMFTSFAIDPPPKQHSPYMIIESYGDLMELYRCASRKPDEYHGTPLYIQGNWKDATQYDEQYFENGYIVAAMTTTASGSFSFEYAAEKQGDKIVVKLDGTCPNPASCDIGGYLFFIPIEGKYVGEAVEINETIVNLPLAE